MALRTRLMEIKKISIATDLPSLVRQQINDVITRSSGWVFNQGQWIRYLLELISSITKEGNDDNINVIVVDFQSSDVDTRAVLQQSQLKHYQLISLPRPFNKVKGIHSAVNRVTDEDSIILLMDLHMQIPYDFFDMVRKHCILGKVAFNPIVLRLAPGHYEAFPAGYWEIMGYGVMAIYKADWDRLEDPMGSHVQMRWGGEDWELVNNILNAGLEIKRFRVPGFFHYHHSHDSLWDHSKAVDKNNQWHIGY